MGRRRNAPPPVRTTGNGRKLIAFGWYGGKYSHLDWLLPLLPACHHYCEPFAGSGAVLINRPPSPVETYNDLDGEVANFFRVLRDQKDELVEKIGLTPFSREEFGLACEIDPKLPAVERARRFYVRARQVRTGLAQTASLGRWANCKDTTRAGMSGVVSRWLGGVEMLPEIADRLLRVQIENRPAIDVIRLYDSSTTLFYCLHPSSPVRMADERISPISDLSPGAKLFGGKTVLQAVTHDHDGDMLAVKVQGLPDDLRVTPEHVVVRIPKRRHKRQETRSDAQLWAEREEVRAEALQEGDYMLLPTGGEERIVHWNWDDQPLPRGVRRDAEFFPGGQLYRLLGYYAAEGHIQRTDGIASGIILSFATTERETWVKDAVDCCRTAFGFEPLVRVGPHESVTQVCIWSRSVTDFFARFIPGTATTKQLDRQLLTAPHTDQRELLLGWLRGDGGLELASRGRVKLLGTSASDSLARQMFQIALRIGLRPSFKVRAGRIYDVYFASEDAVTLGYIPRPRRICTTRRVINGHVLARVRSIERYPYSGPVCDITVDDDSLFAAPFALVHNCDPPYIHETRGDDKAYGYEMTNHAHRELARVLNAVKGMVAISNYDCPLMDELYPEPRWMKHISEARTIHSTKDVRVEVLWTNYDPKSVAVHRHRQTTQGLFDDAE